MYADEDELDPTLFVNPTTGKPLKAQEVSALWSRAVLDGSGVHFGPHMCRSIYVVGSRDRGMPELPGAAMIMGNSQSVWDTSYDRHFNKRQAAEAMAAMPAWRDRMLAEAKGKKGQAGANDDDEDPQEGSDDDRESL